MAFSDTFAQCMAQYGINMDPGNVDDPNALQQAANDLYNWYSSLTDPESIDAITSDDPTHSYLTDGSVGGVTVSVPNLLAAFDAAIGVPFSHEVAALSQCVTYALQADQGDDQQQSGG
jgi:hypothetical protein